MGTIEIDLPTLSAPTALQPLMAPLPPIASPRHLLQELGLVSWCSKLFRAVRAFTRLSQVMRVVRVGVLLGVGEG